MASTAIKRPLLFTMRMAKGERVELEQLAKRRHMSAADLVRSLIRNDALYALEWVERPCEVCAEPFNFRADVLPPYRCHRHEAPARHKLVKGGRRR